VVVVVVVSNLPPHQRHCFGGSGCRERVIGWLDKSVLKVDYCLLIALMIVGYVVECTLLS